MGSPRVVELSEMRVADVDNTAITTNTDPPNVYACLQKLTPSSSKDSVIRSTPPHYNISGTQGRILIRFSACLSAVALSLM